jgi:hypothetical protein
MVVLASEHILHKGLPVPVVLVLILMVLVSVTYEWSLVLLDFQSLKRARLILGCYLSWARVYVPYFGDGGDRRRWRERLQQRQQPQQRQCWR